MRSANPEEAKSTSAQCCQPITTSTQRGCSGLILLANGKTGFFCFTRVGEPAHIAKIFYPFGVEAAWHTVLICCTMCGTEQPKEQPQIGDRRSNPVPINQFLIFFFLLGLHVIVLFFHLLIFFILCGLLHFIKFYFEILPISLLNFLYCK